MVESYDRLVAQGYLEARRGAGFFTTAAREAAIHHMPSDGQKHNEELVWLVRRLLEAREGTVLAGGPWLPREWMDETGIRQSLSALARKSGAHLIEYGNPQGYLPLREHLVLMLSELGITARASQIVLTQGTSQALDLITRHFIKPGDGVLVDDPGYYNLFGSLRLHGAKLLGVPRNPDGPDIDALERLAAEHRPRIYFTQSALQNPTGTDMSPHASFRVLQLAEQYDFLVVEDDIFCDFQIRKTPRLAALDQFNRVIYARSFSKTFSGSLRVGFLVAQQAIADNLADVKMLSSITSSQFVERLLYSMLVDGHYRKFLTRLHKRLGEARLGAIQSFRAPRAAALRRAGSGHVPMGALPPCGGCLDADQERREPRHHAGARRGVPAASAALALDALQRDDLRRSRGASLARACGRPAEGCLGIASGGIARDPPPRLRLRECACLG